MNEIMQKLIAMMNQMMPDVDTSNVTESTSLQQDLGLDSLNMMLLAISVEDLFGITLGPDFEAGTVGDLCRYIEKASAGK